jgi:hypothetical protein
MSTSLRLFLGVALILIALGFLALVPVFAAAGDAFPPLTLYATGGLAVFCGLGAIACFSQASHPITIRIIGGIIFASSRLYVVDQAFEATQMPQRNQAANPANFRGARLSRPSLINSLMFFGLIGLPSGYAALRGGYPSWGMHARAFGSDEKRRSEAEASNEIP